jgi:excisionase family DNA binding protein
MNINSTPLLIKKPEAARRLSICKRTLERLIASGEFPKPVKIGGGSFIPESDLKNYIEKLMGARERQHTG